MDNDEQVSSEEILKEDEEDPSLVDPLNDGDSPDDDHYKKNDEEPLGESVSFAIMKDMYPNDDFSGAY